MKKKKPEFEGKMRLKKGDEVIVLSGKDKNKTERHKILETLPDRGMVVVEGINVVKKHQKPRSANTRAMVKQQLGEIETPAPIPVGKVMLVCTQCHRETRIATESTDAGWARKCRKCGALI